MRLDRYLDQRIAGLAAIAAGIALVAQADLLAIDEAGRDHHIQLLAVGHGQAALAAARRIEKTDLEIEMAVGTALRLAGTGPRAPGTGTGSGTRAGLAAAGTAHMAEDLVEDVFGTTGAKAAGAEIEIRLAVGARCRIGAAALAAGTEAARPRLAGGIDLAAVELCAFVGIADDAIGRRDFLEAFGRLVVAGIAVGMQFLGQLAIGLAHVFLGGAPGHTQHLVGVTHGKNRSHTCRMGP